jgi:hypothetical protein
LQQLVDKDAAEQAIAINPIALDLRAKTEASYAASGGEEIKLPQDEQAAMMKTLASVGDEVSKSSPALAAAYKVVADVATRTRQPASQ